jgi:hypothetical protein
VALLRNPFAFDETGFEYQGERDAVLVWLTPKGDSLGLFHFGVSPDIEADLHDIVSLRAFYRRGAHEAGLGVVEIETGIVDGCLVARTVFKLAQRPMGRTYVGALTFPFQNVSYVFKVQSPERGMTGMRDSVVLAKQLSAGASTMDTKTGQLNGWLDDPYDANETGPMTRNISERTEYDLQFPDHPLSRARWVLDHLQRTLAIDEAVKQQTKFSPAP